MTGAGDLPRFPVSRRGRTAFPMSRTRAELLRGAVRAFAERGVRRTAMQDIAATAGVAKATLYNHFRTKDDVARAALTAELDRVTALAQGRPPPEALLVLAEETARHPVLRRLAETEPELLVRLLGMPGEEWTALVAAVGAVTGLSPADGELATRWLLGLVLQPGTATLRQRCAQRLADHPGHVPDGSGSPV